MTTFSMMSDPDILLTIKAYSRLKISHEYIIKEFEDDGMPEDSLLPMLEQIKRLDELNESLLNEWQKRGNP